MESAVKRRHQDTPKEVVRASASFEIEKPTPKTLRKRPRVMPQDEPLRSDIEVTEIGGNKVLARLSNSTETSVAVDFAEVQNQLHQIAAIARRKRDNGISYEPQEIRGDFNGKRVLDFADDAHLCDVVRGGNTTKIAAEMIGNVIGLSEKSILQYAKRQRIAGRNQRKVIPRR